MTPMHHSRKDDPIEISHNFLEWLALVGWLWWQRRTDCARFAVRRNAQRFHFSPIVRNPIRQSMQVFAKLLQRNITKRLWIFHAVFSRSPPAPHTPADYGLAFGASEATIFSNRASPRSGSQISSNLSDP